MNERTEPKPVGVRDWMATLFLLALPGVNLIMLFVWAFTTRTAPSKANWARATLLWIGIGLALWLLGALGVAAGIAILSTPPEPVQ